MPQVTGSLLFGAGEMLEKAVAATHTADPVQVGGGPGAGEPTRLGLPVGVQPAAATAAAAAF